MTFALLRQTHQCALMRMGMGCALFLLLSLPGCALPDVAPFTDATIQLQSAVSSCGSVVENELRAGAGQTDDSTDEYQMALQQADSLKAQWKHREAVFNALIEYAQSIQAIANAGNSGAESAAAVANGVKSIASAAGVVLPGSPEAIGVVTDTAKFIYAQVSIVIASKSLEEALANAQPAINRVAELVAEDLEDLDAIVQAANQIILVNLSADNNELTARRNTCLNILNTVKEADLQDSETLDKINKISAILASMQAEYDAYLAKRDEITSRLQAAQQLIASTQTAIKTWAASHTQLQAAVREKRTVNTQALTQAATEIAQLVKRMQEL